MKRGRTPEIEELADCTTTKRQCIRSPWDMLVPDVIGIIYSFLAPNEGWKLAILCRKNYEIWTDSLAFNFGIAADSCFTREQFLASNVDERRRARRAVYYSINPCDWSNLERMCDYDHPKVAKLLIDQRANVNVHSVSPFYYAAINNNVELARLLVANGAHVYDVFGRSVKFASAYGKLEAVKYLSTLVAGYKPYYQDGLRKAIQNGHFETVKFLYAYLGAEANDGDHLGLAVRGSHFDIVKFLVTAGEGKGIRGIFAYLCALGGSTAIANYLVDNLASVGVYKDMALHYAVEHGDLESVKYLIDSKSPVISDEVVDLALERGSIEVAKYLMAQRGMHLYHLTCFHQRRKTNGNSKLPVGLGSRGNASNGTE